jgi:hypothetical protein
MNTTTSQLLPIPAGLSGTALVAAINDRLRRIAQQQTTVRGGTVSAPTPTVSLFVNGALAIESDAAPNPYLASIAAPSRLSAHVKQAPTGAALTFTINAGGGDWKPVIIGAGATSATVPNPGSIAANTPVRVNITAVGTTYPGSDLAIFLYF